MAYLGWLNDWPATIADALGFPEPARDADLLARARRAHLSLNARRPEKSASARLSTPEVGQDGKSQPFQGFTSHEGLT